MNHSSFFESNKNMGKLISIVSKHTKYKKFSLPFKIFASMNNIAVRYINNDHENITVPIVELGVGLWCPYYTGIAIGSKLLDKVGSQLYESQERILKKELIANQELNHEILENMAIMMSVGCVGKAINKCTSEIIHTISHPIKTYKLIKKYIINSVKYISNKINQLVVKNPEDIKINIDEHVLFLSKKYNFNKENIIAYQQLLEFELGPKLCMDDEKIYFNIQDSENMDNNNLINVDIIPQEFKDNLMESHQQIFKDLLNIPIDINSEIFSSHISSFNTEKKETISFDDMDNICSLVSNTISLCGNSNLGNQIGIISESSITISKSIIGLGLKTLSPLAFCTNIVKCISNIKALFSSSIHSKIINEIKKIQEFLIIIHKEMHQRFDIIDENLIDIKNMLQKISDQSEDLKIQINQFEIKNKNMHQNTHDLIINLDHKFDELISINTNNEKNRKIDLIKNDILSYTKRGDERDIELEKKTLKQIKIHLEDTIYSPILTEDEVDYRFGINLLTKKIKYDKLPNLYLWKYLSITFIKLFSTVYQNDDHISKYEFDIINQILDTAQKFKSFFTILKNDDIICSEYITNKNNYEEMINLITNDEKNEVMTTYIKKTEIVINEINSNFTKEIAEDFKKIQFKNTHPDNWCDYYIHFSGGSKKIKFDLHINGNIWRCSNSYGACGDNGCIHRMRNGQVIEFNKYVDLMLNSFKEKSQCILETNKKENLKGIQYIIPENPDLPTLILNQKIIDKFKIDKDLILADTLGFCKLSYKYLINKKHAIQIQILCNNDIIKEITFNNYVYCWSTSGAILLSWIGGLYNKNNEYKQIDYGGCEYCSKKTINVPIMDNFVGFVDYPDNFKIEYSETKNYQKYLKIYSEDCINQKLKDEYEEKINRKIKESKHQNIINIHKKSSIIMQSYLNYSCFDLKIKLDNYYIIDNIDKENAYDKTFDMIYNLMFGLHEKYYQFINTSSKLITNTIGFKTEEINESLKEENKMLLNMIRIMNEEVMKLENNEVRESLIKNLKKKIILSQKSPQNIHLIE
jgi:hypothetical protein